VIPFPNQLCNDSEKEHDLLKNFRILEIVMVSVCFILTLYFLLASFNGEFGVSAKYQLLAREKILFKELEIIIQESNALKNRIKGMSDTSLDLELLDQQARKILGMIGEEELIVY
jgi:cell division protein FtsB